MRRKTGTPEVGRTEGKQEKRKEEEEKEKEKENIT